MCKVNNEGRMVFSVCAHVNGEIELAEAVSIFKKNYKKIHGNNVRPLGKHNFNSPNYPTMGTDYVEDLSPATIIILLRVSFNNSNESAGILPAFIMQLTKEVESW